MSLSRHHLTRQNESVESRLPRLPADDTEEASTEFEDFEDGDPIVRDEDAWDDDEWTE